MTPPVLRVVARALQLQRELVATRELAARYAAELRDARWEAAVYAADGVSSDRQIAEAHRWIRHLEAAHNEELKELRVTLARELAHHAETLRALEGLRATPRPRAHMDWEGER